MAAFEFRLESVLRLRERVKEEKQSELVALNQAMHTLKAAIDALDRELRHIDDTMGAGAGEFLSVIDLKLAGEYGQMIEHRIKEKTAALSKLDDALTGKRGELVEAQRGLKSLERLRQRGEEKFRREQDRAEQKFTDEVAQRKFVVGPSRK